MTADDSALNRTEWSQQRATDPGPPANLAEPSQNRSEALAEIARTHNSALVRYLSLRTGSVEDAKDVLQEAYAKLLALDQAGPINFLVRYLWRIAANLAKNRRKQLAVRSRLNVATQSATKSIPSTECVIESLQRLAVIERAVAELPPRCRQAFLLRIVAGQRFAQVAREMGITQRVAEIHVARAMEYLQQRLASAETPRGGRSRE